MVFEFGQPFTPRNDKETFLNVALIGSSSAIPVIAITNYSACSAVPGLTTLQLVWFCVKLLDDGMGLWYNIPKDMQQKDKLKTGLDESGNPMYPSAPLVCNLKDFVSISFLVISLVGFSKVVPEIDGWGGGEDQCNGAVFTTAVMCFGIPTVIAAGMLLYGVFLLAKYLVKGKDGEDVADNMKALKDDASPV